MLGVVPVEMVEPGCVVGCGTVTGVGVGVPGVGLGTVGVGTGVTVGLGGGEKVSLETITVVVGAVGLESSHAPTNRVSRTNALIRVIPHARATAIPRFGCRFANSRAVVVEHAVVARPSG
jgi:hypothetical protein